MKTRLLNWVAILLILEIGILHLMTTQEEYEEVAYMGYLFIGNFLTTLVAAYGIYLRQFWGWALGLFISLGSIAGYIWSRTVGMPGMEVEEWLAPYAVTAAALEVIFVLMFFLRLWRYKTDEPLSSSMDKILRYLEPLGGLFILVLVSALTYRWDVILAGL